MTENHPEESLVPVRQHDSGLVLGTLNVAGELEEYYNENEIVAQSAGSQIYNIENSSDVIIGPVTQITGPVTIYQSGSPQDIAKNLSIRPTDNNANTTNDTKLVKSESTTSDPSPNHPYPQSKLKRLLKEHLNFKVSCLVVICLVLVVVIITTTIIIFGRPPEKPQPHSNFPSTVPPITIPDHIYDRNLSKHKLIYRDGWGGRFARNFTRILQHPVPLVIISHSASPGCTSVETCSVKVRDFQDYHVNSLQSPDVGYNFLIGGDGNIYVGRGWDIRNFHDDHTIGICFIGNYVYSHLTSDMIEACQMLMSQGVELGKLAENYKLVAHNQTYNTQSPGENVYEVIKTWPHFDASYKGTK